MIPSQANYLMVELLGGLSARAITFYTLNDPGHGIGDVLALTHDDIRYTS